jgi:Trp operon repressor
MTEQDERKWRQLCNQAMSENDPNKLLNIFLELDEVMEQEQRVAAPVDFGRKRNRPALREAQGGRC